MLNFIGHIIAGVGLFIGSLFGYQPPPQVIHTPPTIVQDPSVQNSSQMPVAASPVYGSFSPSGGSTYRLGQSIGTSNTTIKISSFKEPVSNIPYTMTYLGSATGYGTISPQTSTSEFVSFTGITQNADGSATLTGLTRGLSRTPGTGGCVASTTLAQSHAGQSIFILSNSPCFYSEYAVKQNNESVPGNWTFTGQTTFSNFPLTPSNSTSTINVAGVNQFATPAQQGASTATSTNGTNAPLSLSSQYGTTTCTGAGTGGYTVIASSTTGRIDGSCEAATFTKNTTFNAPVTFASSTSGTYGNKEYLNLSPTSPTGASTTVFAFSIPANTLSTSNYIVTTLYISASDLSQTGACSSSFEIAYGTGSSTLAFPSNRNVGGGGGYMRFVLAANGATNSQKLSLEVPGSIASSSPNFSVNTISQDSTQAKQLTFVGLAGCGLTPAFVTSELYN